MKKFIFAQHGCRCFNALMETRLDRETKIALVNFTSPSQAFSEYVLDELSSVLVNNSHLTVVDRANLERIRQEPLTLL